jgi:hypothetical protein
LKTGKQKATVLRWVQTYSARILPERIDPHRGGHCSDAAAPKAASTRGMRWRTIHGAWS